MVRSSLVVVSDDPGFIQKAEQFAQGQGVVFKVLTPANWDSMNSSTPSLTAGGKVLQFPANGGGSDGVATMNQLESEAIERAIHAFKGNLTEAAKALGIGRATLYRKVKQYKIDPANARKRKQAA